MKIRKATKKDIQQMMEIIKLNNPKYPKKDALNELNEMFSKALYKPTYIVVEEKRKILAFNGFNRSSLDDCVVNLFWANTHPDYQGRGIQTRLIKDLLQRIKQLKNPKIKMVMFSTRIPSFFKKFGFKKTTPKYDRDYILMERRLKILEGWNETNKKSSHTSNNLTKFKNY